MTWPCGIDGWVRMRHEIAWDAFAGRRYPAVVRRLASARSDDEAAVLGLLSSPVSDRSSASGIAPT